LNQLAGTLLGTPVGSICVNYYYFDIENFHFFFLASFWGLVL